MRKIICFLLVFISINCSKDDDSSGNCLVCDYAETTTYINGEMVTELIPWDDVAGKICAGAEVFGVTYSKAMLQALLQDPESSCEGCNCRLE